MRYLKGYKLFENVNMDLSKIKEAFYSVSDKYFVDVILYCGEGNNYIDGIRNMGQDDLIKVQIRSTKVGELIDPDRFINYDSIKDDLEFAEDYINDILKLNLDSINIYGFNDLQNNFNSFTSLENLDKYNVKYFNSINLFFKIQKNAQILV